MEKFGRKAKTIKNTISLLKRNKSTNFEGKGAILSN